MFQDLLSVMISSGLRKPLFPDVFPFKGNTKDQICCFVGSEGMEFIVLPPQD